MVSFISSSMTLILADDSNASAGMFLDAEM